jgi:succinate dehydrogenase hydrophobic anchor subunit
MDLGKGSSDRTVPEQGTPVRTLQRWGGLASILLAVASLGSALIYLTGNLRDPYGALAYDLADLLHGPAWAVCLVVTVLALREHMGKGARGRMWLALLAAALAAATMISVVCIRSANRHYHLRYPELHLENSSEVLVVWTTLLAGLTAAAQHLLGWALALVGWAGWTSRRLPRALCVLQWVMSVGCWLVFLRPQLEELVLLPGIVVSIWQGVFLWRSQPNHTLD